MAQNDVWRTASVDTGTVLRVRLEGTAGSQSAVVIRQCDLVVLDGVVYQRNGMTGDWSYLDGGGVVESPIEEPTAEVLDMLLNGG